MRLLVDCTFVFLHPGIRTGIQRVVRNISRHAQDASMEKECIPVIFLDGKVFKILRLMPRIPERIISKGHDELFGVIDRLTGFSRNFATSKKASWPIQRGTAFYLGCSAVAMLLKPPLMILQKMRMRLSLRRVQHIEVDENDVLILLDTSWSGSVLKEIEVLKERGIYIIAVIYDVIPLTHPQFCKKEIVEQFEHWFEWVSVVANGFMAISVSTKFLAKEMMKPKLLDSDFDQKWFDHFYLGSELDLKHNTRIRRAFSTIFQSDQPVYLMVSTIEPRKNHHYLMDAFDHLWNAGSKVILCFIGGIGWENEDLLLRIEQHSECGVHLFLFNNVNDTELEYAYQHSKALVFSSFVEGFGLPLVEAMQRGLPAMASDIPVFREVGGQFCAYFDLGDPESLVRLVEEYESTGRFPATRSLEDWQWPGWRDSTTQLFDRILGHVTLKPNNN